MNRFVVRGFCVLSVGNSTRHFDETQAEVTEFLVLFLINSAW